MNNKALNIFVIVGVVAAITGHLTWILSLINLAWLLIKDHTLFSWGWVIGDAVLFVVAGGIMLVAWRKTLY